MLSIKKRLHKRTTSKLGIIGASVGLMLFGMSVTANATTVTIDFEEFSNQNLRNQSVSTQGFTVTHSGSFAFIGTSGNLSSNGTRALTSFNTSTISIAESTGGVFDFTSFQGGESWLTFPHAWAEAIEVVGTLSGGGTISQQFTLDLIKNTATGLELFTVMSGFTNLVNLEFRGVCIPAGTCNPEFGLDNLNLSVSAVPLPAAAWLFLTAIGGMFGMRKLKTA